MTYKPDNRRPININDNTTQQQRTTENGIVIRSCKTKHVCLTFLIRGDSF